MIIFHDHIKYLVKNNFKKLLMPCQTRYQICKFNIFQTRMKYRTKCKNFIKKIIKTEPTMIKL